MDDYLSFRDIGKMTNMSPATVKKRVMEMKATGDYKGAFIKPKRAILVSLSMFEKYLIRRAEE